MRYTQNNEGYFYKTIFELKTLYLIYECRIQIQAHNTTHTCLLPN